MKYTRIKGTHDILPAMTPMWQYVEETIRNCMQIFNYKEIRTPIFEQTEVFARGIGQLTDIVSKEMYTFQDKGEKYLTLKPEMTAPVMRAYLENKMGNQSPSNKLYYISPLFRQENPQAGRQRQGLRDARRSRDGFDKTAEAVALAAGPGLFLHGGCRWRNSDRNFS